MKEWFSEYWPYALLLVFACAVAFFAFRAAARAYSAHKKSYREEEEYILRLKALKEKYVPLSVETIKEAPDEELLEGVALGLQIALQKTDDLEAEFEKLSDEKKLIYTLDIFTEDKTLEKFFKENSAVLKSRLVPALEKVSLSSYAKRIEPVALMFDDKDETTSLDEQRVKDFDAELEKEGFLSLIKLSAAKYIKENPKAFCDCN